jgi:hypothetical protein
VAVEFSPLAEVLLGLHNVGASSLAADLTTDDAAQNSPTFRALIVFPCYSSGEGLARHVDVAYL